MLVAAHDTTSRCRVPVLEFCMRRKQPLVICRSPKRLLAPSLCRSRQHFHRYFNYPNIKAYRIKSRPVCCRHCACLSSLLCFGET